jgi:RhtB (resistance to homoserine/threonine) family protein
MGFVRPLFNTWRTRNWTARHWRQSLSDARASMHDTWIEFTKVALAHLLAVASPGPDFAIVLRQSLVHGRRTGVWTSIGVGTAILLHIVYSLLGLGLVLRSSETWFGVVKISGALYLAWLGVKSLRARPRDQEASEAATAPAVPGGRGAFMTGFLTNALNPKATLFFIALFTVVIDPGTPRWVQAGYGLWMSGATMAWFAFVACAFTHEAVRGRFMKHGHWIDRALGVVFLGFAASLAFTTIRAIK